jgi:hypothetical protein
MTRVYYILKMEATESCDNLTASTKLYSVKCQKTGFLPPYLTFGSNIMIVFFNAVFIGAGSILPHLKSYQGLLTWQRMHRVNVSYIMNGWSFTYANSVCLHDVLSRHITSSEEMSSDIFIWALNLLRANTLRFYVEFTLK